MEDNRIKEAIKKVDKIFDIIPDEDFDYDPGDVINQMSHKLLALKQYLLSLQSPLLNNSEGNIRDEVITGTFAIGNDGKKEPTDWKEYALKLEERERQLWKSFGKFSKAIKEDIKTQSTHFHVNDNSDGFRDWLRGAKIDFIPNGHFTSIPIDKDIFTLGYEFALYKQKTVSAPLKEGDSMSIDELLSEFKRQGFNTENWDGDEGAEKAIVDGVKNHIAEIEINIKTSEQWYMKRIADLEQANDNLRNLMERQDNFVSFPILTLSDDDAIQIMNNNPINGNHTWAENRILDIKAGFNAAKPVSAPLDKEQEEEK